MIVASWLYYTLLFSYPLRGSEPFHWQLLHLLSTNHVYWNRVAVLAKGRPQNAVAKSWPPMWLGGDIGSQISEFLRFAKVWMIPTHPARFCRFSFKTAFTNSLYRSSHPAAPSRIQLWKSPQTNLRANHPRWRKKKRRILSSFSSSCPVPHCSPHPESQLNPKSMALILFKVVSSSMTEQKSPNVSSQWD